MADINIKLSFDEQSRKEWKKRDSPFLFGTKTANLRRACGRITNLTTMTDADDIFAFSNKKNNFMFTWLHAHRIDEREGC